LVALSSFFGYTDIEDPNKRNFTMQSNTLLFAGVEISAGRKPVTLAALDEDSNITILEKWDISTTLSCLQEYKNISLGINKPSSKIAQRAYQEFKNQIAQADFQPFSAQDHPKQWFETSTQACYREWLGQNPLPRRTFEGRLQRALVLYEQALRIEDPMEIFEEITRYKLIKGVFRLENVYSSKELDALVAAYLAWMSINRPERIVAKGEFVLPAQE
jgi:hypothetical protein